MQLRNARCGLNDSTGRAYTETRRMPLDRVPLLNLNDSTGRAYTETVFINPVPDALEVSMIALGGPTQKPRGSI